MLLHFIQEGEMTKEQIEEEIRRIKEAHAEDEGTFSSLILESGVCGIIIKFIESELCRSWATLDLRNSWKDNMHHIFELSMHIP